MLWPGPPVVPVRGARTGGDLHPLSAVIIARDEVDRIEQAIRSVGFAHEVVVLDSGSLDGTAELAASLGARVIRTDWPGHVAQKNRGLEAARHLWVLSVDADERVSPRLRRSIEAALVAPAKTAGFRVRRRNHYLGVPLTAGDWYPDARIRLVRRDLARWTGEDPHDRLEVRGAVRDLEGHLEHHPYRNLGEHLATMDRYSRRFVEVTKRRAHWWDLVFRPPWALFRGLVLKGGVRDGARGWLVANLGSTYTLLKWSRLYLAHSPVGTGGARDGRDCDHGGKPWAEE